MKIKFQRGKIKFLRDETEASCSLTILVDCFLSCLQRRLTGFVLIHERVLYCFYIIQLLYFLQQVS